MNALSAFGLFAVTAMLVCYALEQRSTWFILAFAGSCGLGSVYGFLQGGHPRIRRQSGGEALVRVAGIPENPPAAAQQLDRGGPEPKRIDQFGRAAARQVAAAILLAAP
jgi:hypothetical protein